MKMLELLFYPLSGFFMKVSDDAHDQKQDKLLGILAAMICGFSIGYLAVISADAACIFLAILFGTVAAWKVDCLNHIISLLIFVGIILVLGFPTLGLLTLAVCSIAAFFDEIGNDSKWASKKKYLREFFRYRFALKIAIFVFTVMGMLAPLYPYIHIVGVQYFAPLTFIGFLMFEISYELVGLKFNALYNGMESFLGIIRGIYRSAND
jgi:hypothetical protein